VAEQDEAIIRETARLRELAAEVEELTAREDEPGTALVPAGGGAAPPEQIKRRLAKMKAEANRRTNALKKQQEKVKGMLAEQMRQAELVMKPMQAMVRRLEEGIWTVNLYLGTQETIKQLADGEPAPADTPITVRQMVLYMDEECAVDAEEGGIDARSMSQFDEWLRESQAHVDQVLPEPKGVVALKPRRKAKEYGNAFQAEQMAKENRQTYFLIRNGERLFRVSTDFQVDATLIPTSDEFTKLFERRDSFTDEVEILKPGTQAWEKAQKRAQAHERHYFRVALILQGLADRTTVFHPLTQAGVSFVEQQHYIEERVRFIMDAEGSIGTGREPFREWQERLMGEVRAGMRVIGDFHSWDSGFRERDQHVRGNSRLHPATAHAPKSHVPHAVEEQKPNGDMIIRYERDETVYDPDMWEESEERPGWGYRGGYRKPKMRASCIVRAGDQWVLPFDLVTVEECEAYLRARNDRHEYTTMFPLLKSVIRAKKEEAAMEAPYRQMLVGVLARDNERPVPEVEGEVDELIAWWKYTNRYHRPLVEGEPETTGLVDPSTGKRDEAKVVRMIVAEHRRRLDDRRRPVRAEVVRKLRTAHPESLLIARPRNAGYLVLLPAEPDVNVYVHEVEYSARGEFKERRDWRLVGSRPARWTIAYEGERWASWNRMALAADYLTAPEVVELGERVRRAEKEDRDEKLLAVTYYRERGEFIRWVVREWEKVDEAHLLTTRPSEPDVAGYAFRWRRRRGGVDLKRELWSTRVAETRDSFSIRRRRRQEEESGPRWRWDTKSHQLLYKDAERIAQVEQAADRHSELMERHHDLHSEAAKWHSNIEDQWIALRERERYDAFLREYSDPHLWEGHAKALNEIRWPTATGADVLWDALAHAVERGVPVEGRTVGELVGDRKARKGQAKDFGLPKGARELVFGAEPVQGPWNEPEAEDDEDDDYEFDD
jgi:hypothetical protein